MLIVSCTVLAVCALVYGVVSAGSTTNLANSDGPEALAVRTYFYVGGSYVESAPGMHLFTDQMYVEELTPLNGATQETPLVMIHGQAQTGTNWLNTPDGRKGWASWFLHQGYRVYIIDQPQQGRSAYRPGDGSLATYSAEYISRLFTAVQDFNAWPQAHLHTQWPGTGVMGDPIYDAFYASQVQFQNDTDTPQRLIQSAGAALLDRIGPAVLITHSQAGPPGFLIADARPSLVRAIVSLEPQGPPFENRVITTSTAIARPYGLTNIPITYDPPVVNPTSDLPYVDVPSVALGLSDCILQSSPAKQLPNLSKIPILVTTSEASFHAGYDYCTVKYLQQAGVPAQYLNLSQAGIHGNAHFFFLEKNNLEIAQRVEEWIHNTLS